MPWRLILFGMCQLSWSKINSLQGKRLNFRCEHSYVYSRNFLSLVIAVPASFYIEVLLVLWLHTYNLWQGLDLCIGVRLYTLYFSCFMNINYDVGIFFIAAAAFADDSVSKRKHTLCIELSLCKQLIQSIIFFLQSVA